MPADRPNVLLIVVDQWRGDALALAGDRHVRTPHLDALAREGVAFRRHFTTGAPCGPARASLLTGMYVMNHRVIRNSTPLDARFTNLAYEVRKAGYDPALVGYTTTTPDPTVTDVADPRFRVLGDVMPGWRPVGALLEPTHEPYYGFLRANGLEVPAERPADIWLPADDGRGSYGATALPARYPAELSDTAWFADAGLEYLRGKEGEPWFLHLGFYRPHPPFIAPAPYNAMFAAADMPAPVRATSPAAEAAQHALTEWYVRTVPQADFFERAPGLASEMTLDQVRQMRATYYGLIAEIDDHLGRVFDYLKATGQWDDTLIVFTCDHGEQLGDHHLLGKLGYFDASFHIPLIVRDPRREADGTRGRVVDAFTETVDTMPTILEWLGRPVPRQVDGRSLLPWMQGQTPPDWRREVHYEFDFREVDSEAPQRALGVGLDDCGLAVIQDADYKYVHFAALPPLLFDLRADPGQFENRAADPACRDVVLRYAQALLSWRMRYADRRMTGFTTTDRGLVSKG